MDIGGKIDFITWLGVQVENIDKQVKGELAGVGKEE